MNNINELDLQELKKIATQGYGFYWSGKGQAVKDAENDETEFIPYTENNMYIEGDNIIALKRLQRDYEGKVKMIYIDPPYNTGNKFIYNDRFKKKTGKLSYGDGRHSDWLNMMYPRLKLARNLLTEDGVIFISIDDNEQTNLKKICDEIFGENNFVGIFTINSTPNARDYGHMGKMHEYVIFYTKNAENAKTNLLPEIEKSFKYYDEISGFNIHPLYNSNVAFNKKNRPNLYYPFYINLNKNINNDFFEISLDKKNGSVEVYPPLSLKDGVQFVWRWGKDKAFFNLNKEIVGYKTSDGEYRIVQKMRHNEKLIRSILIDTSFSSRRGTAEVEEILKNKFFSFPKPVALIKNFIMVGSTEANDIILDFFSGSATTAHATMQLNAEDGGNRKYIMVQLPEPTPENSEAAKAGYKNICEIGKERIRRAGEKIKSDESLPLENREKLDTDFEVIKL